MAAQIFLSCGQASEAERTAVAQLKATLIQMGFSVYAAIQAQSLDDVNSGIIRQLQASDYYLFVDFRRESLAGVDGSDARGSLFTHQELAIAHVLGFEHVLLFQQVGVKLEGLLRYMGGNPASFETAEDLVHLVRGLVQDRGWAPGYSRHLVAVRPRWSDTHLRTPQLTGLFLYVDIENRRPHMAAWNTVARLEFITKGGQPRRPCRNRALLKTTGQPGFSQVIWPLSHGAFDALMVDGQGQVYLHNALDVRPDPILEGPGDYELEYAVLAREFPVLRFTLDLQIPATGERPTAIIREAEPNHALHPTPAGATVSRRG